MTEDNIPGTEGNWFDIHLQDWSNDGWNTSELTEYLISQEEHQTEAVVHIEYLILHVND